jgi:hypothetical protein
MVEFGSVEPGIEISLDNYSWETLWKNATEPMMDAAWVTEELDISSYAAGELSVYIRWTIGPTDASVTYPGWNIDDLEILAVPPVPGD